MAERKKDYRDLAQTLSGLGMAFSPEGSWQRQLGQLTINELKRKAEANILKSLKTGASLDPNDLKYASPETVFAAEKAQQERTQTNIQKAQTRISAKQAGSTIRYQKQLGEESAARAKTYEEPATRRTGELQQQKDIIAAQTSGQKELISAKAAEEAKQLIPMQQNLIYDPVKKTWVKGQFQFAPSGEGYGFTDPTKMNQYRDLVNMEYYQKANERYKETLPENQRATADLMNALTDPSTGKVQWEKMFGYMSDEEKAGYSSRMAQYATLPKGYPGETVFADIYKQPEKVPTIVQQFSDKNGTLDIGALAQSIQSAPPDQQQAVMKQLMLEGGVMSAAETPDELNAAYAVNPSKERYKQYLEEVKKRGWTPQ